MLLTMDMRIIAFVIEAASVQRIPDHIGEPSTPPGISPCRGPPPWEETVEPVFLDEVVQPGPEYPVDQTVRAMLGAFFRTFPSSCLCGPLRVPAFA